MAIFKAIEENTLPTEAARSRRAEPRHQTTVVGRLGYYLARVDGFDQDTAESKRDERAVILRRLLTSKCDTFEALEFADRLFDACPRLVKCFWKEGGHVFGVGSIRDCRAYSALACGSAVGFGIVALITERGARIDIGADVEKRLEVAAIAGLTTGEMKASRSRRGDNRF